MSTLELPERLNAAAVFVDSHIEAGRGEKTAILCEDQTVTYRQLLEGVNRMGNALRQLGVRMEERVAILMPDTPECVYAFFGAMKIGAVAIPTNTILQPKDYRYLLNDSRARVLIVHSSMLDSILAIRDDLKYLEHILVDGDQVEGFDSLASVLEPASAELAPVDTHKDDAAFWLYSSGTTGFPKGTIHLHHDMLVEAEYYAKQTIGVQESDTSFSIAKLFFAYGLGNGLYFPLWTGGTAVLLPGRPTPDAIFGVIDRHQPTVYYGVPTSYAALLAAAEKSGRTDFGKVRMCVSAGEPLPAPIFNQWKDRFGVEILDGIGSTEILHIFISNRPGRARPGSTGEIVPGYEGKIVDELRRDVPTGEFGTLLIKGDSIAQGYWNKHEQTKNTFLGEWIDTHDQFRVDEDGYYWYAGRADDMMKVSGLYVSPAEVESILKRHDAVLESGVVGVRDANGLLKPKAFVVLKEGREASDDLVKELQTLVKTSTDPHKYPRWVEFLTELPKTATGKIQRYKLRQTAEEE
jgi:benzoate-CoA ligase